ncbi:MAG: hypothetical protein OSA11_04685 [Candidatus Nanopelagicales bacterium]|nr:hypothetical protein [Candidatus Nanopelagicales bacterium]
MSRSRKIAASVILTGGLVLSGVAAPAMAATGPAKKHAKEVSTVYYEFGKAYGKGVKAFANSDPKSNAQICQNFTDGGTNKKGQNVATIQALESWNDKKNNVTVNGKPWRKIVNKTHFIGMYTELLKWRCSGSGGTPRTFK